MRQEVRPAIAFIAAKLISNVGGGSVYDFSRAGYAYFSGQVGDSVSIYDHTSRAHITGSPSQLYHHQLGEHISLSIKGKEFSGFDFGTHQHFSGAVNRHNVQLFDYDGSGWHHFLVT